MSHMCTYNTSNNKMIPQRISILRSCLFVCFFILQALISHQFYTHQYIHVNPNCPIQRTTIPTPPQFSPLGVHMSVLYICVSNSALQTSSSVPFFQGYLGLCFTYKTHELGCFLTLSLVLSASSPHFQPVLLDDLQCLPMLHSL